MKMGKFKTDEYIKLKKRIKKYKLDNNISFE